MEIRLFLIDGIEPIVEKVLITHIEMREGTN
jgi:hypothetical protein